MGDELVNDIQNSVADLAAINGLDVNRLNPIVDALVNRMRNRGWEDDEIRAALDDDEERTFQGAADD